jgi:amphi-Trp domain-containing protein
MAKKVKKRLAKQQAKTAKRAMKAERRQHRRKAQAVLSREQIAEQLRALASQVEGGTFVLGDKQLELPTHAQFEVSYKVKRLGAHQIEVEIEWNGPRKVALFTTE